MVSTSEVESLSRHAVELAVARFLREGHPMAEEGAAWITPEIEYLAGRATVDLEREAERCDGLLDGWQRWARTEDPSAWASHRTLALHARRALAAARTGSFDVSTGALHDFLIAAGAPTRHFDVF